MRGRRPTSQDRDAPMRAPVTDNEKGHEPGAPLGRRSRICHP